MKAKRLFNTSVKTLGMKGIWGVGGGGELSSGSRTRFDSARLLHYATCCYNLQKLPYFNLIQPAVKGGWGWWGGGWSWGEHVPALSIHNFVNTKANKTKCCDLCGNLFHNNSISWLTINCSHDKIFPWQQDSDSHVFQHFDF